MDSQQGRKRLERIVLDPADDSCRLVDMTNAELGWLLVLLKEELEAIVAKEAHGARMVTRTMH